MSVQNSVNKAMGIFSMGVLLAGLVGCAAQNSKDVPQPMIYPMYSASYYAGQKAVVFRSSFKFGATPATASSIQLKNGSVVKVNDTQMKESSKTARIGAPTEYAYDYTLNDVAPETLGKPFVFIYVDNDGRSYANEALIPAPVTAEIPVEFERAQGLTIPWAVGDQLGKNEIIRAEIQFPLSKGFYMASAKAGEKSGALIMSAAEFTGFQAGQVKVTVCRQRAAETVNSAQGGVLTTEFCAPAQDVQMK